MMPFPLDVVPGIVVSGYESLLRTFGSPEMLLALSATLVILATVELCVRRPQRPRSEVD